MSAEIKKQINKLKITAYDLLQKVYISVAETKRLQGELARVENEIAALRESDVNP